MESEIDNERGIKLVCCDITLLFEDMEEENIRELSEYFERETFKKNQCIVNQNIKSGKIYFLTEGRVKTTLEDKNGDLKTRSILLPGDSFGELAFFNEGYPICGVYAVTGVTLYSIRCEVFYKVVVKYPGMQRNLMTNLMKQIQKMNNSYLNYLNNDMKGRIGLILLRLAEESGTHCNSSVTVDSMPVQKDIASLAGTSRETVSRTLSRLEREDYIIRKGKKIIIKDYKQFYNTFSI